MGTLLNSKTYFIQSVFVGIGPREILDCVETIWRLCCCCVVEALNRKVNVSPSERSIDIIVRYRSSMKP